MSDAKRASTPVFIGDEWTAAGWRLAGLEIMTPTSDGVVECLNRVLAARPPLLLLSAEVAAWIDEARLLRLRERADPPIVVVGDAAGRGAVDRLTRGVRRRMGVTA